MRVSIVVCVVVLPFLEGCEHVVYYSPSGPGRTVVGDRGAPSTREIKIDSDSTISVWIDNESVPAVVQVFIELRKGIMRLVSPEVQFACPQIVSAPIEKIIVSRVLDGTWNLSEGPWDMELVGTETALPLGGVADGRYWIRTSVPSSCAQGTFSVHLPKFTGTISELPVKPIVFRLREGHFTPFHEIM